MSDEIKVNRYNRRYIIPDWDKNGNHQMFVQNEAGDWLDCVEEVYRSQAWIDEHIAPYFKLAPDNISLIDFLNQDK